jgi:TP901-1 family phage major tail protein
MAEKGSAFLLRKAPAGATVTFTNATNLCTYTSHGMSAGDAIIFTNSGGALPAELTASQVYYAGDITTHTFTIHLTKASGVAGTSDVSITDDGTGTSTGKIMTTVAGMRTTGFSINGSEVDITTKDSTSQWRELSPATGEVSMTVTAAGVFQDDAGLAAMRVDSIARTFETYGLQFESGDEYWGLFQVTSCEQAGEYNDAVTFSITLESGGVITLVDNV